MKIRVHTLDLDKEVIVPTCKAHQFCHFEELCSKQEKCFDADLVQLDQPSSEE